jgi:hypothetical protein
MNWLDVSVGVSAVEGILSLNRLLGSGLNVTDVHTDCSLGYVSLSTYYQYKYP